MLYCERCGLLYDGEKCPQCKKAHGREPREDDLCLLAEKGQIEADMLADILEQNGVKSLLKGSQGAGLSMYTGLMLETFRIYVNYSDLDRAQELMEVFFTPLETDEAEESEDGEEHD